MLFDDGLLWRSHTGSLINRYRTKSADAARYVSPALGGENKRRQIIVREEKIGTSRKVTLARELVVTRRKPAFVSDPSFSAAAFTEKWVNRISPRRETAKTRVIDVLERAMFRASNLGSAKARTNKRTASVRRVLISS